MRTSALLANLVLAMTVLMISSCSITKRRYNKGFNVDWHIFKTAKSHKNNSHSSMLCTAKADGASVVIPVPSCDSVFLKNGDTLLVENVEIRIDQIEFNTCDSSDSSRRTMDRNFIETIVFENGPRVRINTPKILIDEDYQTAFHRARLSTIFSLVSLAASFVVPFSGILLLIAALILAFSSASIAPKPMEKHLKRRIGLAFGLAIFQFLLLLFAIWLFIFIL